MKRAAGVVAFLSIERDDAAAVAEIDREHGLREDG